MRTLLTTVFLAGAMTCTGLCDDGDFQWQGQLAPGKLLTIRSAGGSIRAEGTSGSTATVTAVKTGTKSDRAAVTIQVVPYDGGVVLCTMYPGSNRPNLCNPPGKDSYISADNGNDVKVEFTVQVPTGVRFEAHTMQGDVQAVSLTGDVDASALSGEITISTTGAAQATTLKGSITALIGSVNWKGDRVFAAGNGSVDLQMPADANVSVVANAFHGEVTSDFPLIITNGASGMFGMAQGTLGEGGRTLRLYAGKGNVSLRQAPAGGQ